MLDASLDLAIVRALCVEPLPAHAAMKLVVVLISYMQLPTWEKREDVWECLFHLLTPALERPRVYQDVCSLMLSVCGNKKHAFIRKALRHNMTHGPKTAALCFLMTLDKPEIADVLQKTHFESSNITSFFDAVHHASRSLSLSKAKHHVIAQVTGRMVAFEMDQPSKWSLDDWSRVVVSALQLSPTLDTSVTEKLFALTHQVLSSVAQGKEGVHTYPLLEAMQKLELSKQLKMLCFQLIASQLASLTEEQQLSHGAASLMSFARAFVKTLTPELCSGVVQYIKEAMDDSEQSTQRAACILWSLMNRTPWQGESNNTVRDAMSDISTLCLACLENQNITNTNKDTSTDTPTCNGLTLAVLDATLSSLQVGLAVVSPHQTALSLQVLACMHKHVHQKELLQLRYQILFTLVSRHVQAVSGQIAALSQQLVRHHTE